MKVTIVKRICDYPSTRPESLQRKTPNHDALYEGVIGKEVVFDTCLKHVSKMVEIRLTKDVEAITIRRIEATPNPIAKNGTNRKWEEFPAPLTCWCGKPYANGAGFYAHLNKCPDAQTHRLDNQNGS